MAKQTRDDYDDRGEVRRIYEPIDQPPSSGGLKLGGMGQIFINVVLAAIVAYGVVTYFGTTKGTYRADISRLESDLVAMRATDSELQSSISNLGGESDQVTALETTVANLEARFNAYAAPDLSNLEASISDLGERIAVFEEEAEEEEIVLTVGTKWDWSDVTILSPVAGLKAKIERVKIQEAGIYDIELELTNANVDPTSSVKIDTAFRVALEPRDDVMIDEDSVYLAFEDDPFSDWDADFIIKRDMCKKIVFESDKFYFGDLGFGESETLDLELGLYYLD